MVDTGKNTTLAIRLYLCFMVVLVLSFFVINIVQSQQTKHGLGIHDTSILSTRDAGTFFTPSHQTGRTTQS